MFLELGRTGLIDCIDQPYPFLDVGAMLHQAREDATSVDSYIAGNKLDIGHIKDMKVHNPLYDAHAALIVYLDLISNKCDN